MKKFFVLFSLSASFLLLNACGGSSVSLGSIDKLPQATNPVITSAAATAASVKVDAAATTGKNFYTETGTSFNRSSNRGMCELFNFSKEVLNSAAQTDKVLCYVKNVVTANNAALAGVNLYDGNFHYIKLVTAAGVEGGRVKMKIVKDGDRISEFEMANCMNHEGGPNTTQTEYLHQQLQSDGTITMVSKDINDETGHAWRGSMSVTGQVNAEGNFVSKAMTAQNKYTESNSAGSEIITMNQYADKMTFSGFTSNTFSGAFGNGSNTTQAYAQYQLLGGTSTSIHDYAMGEGSVKATISNVCGSCGWTAPPATTDVSSWNGDTTATIAATSGTYYTATNAGTVPAVTTVSIDWATSEAWDCLTGMDTATTLTFNQTSLDTTCAKYSMYQDDNHSWINCWQLIDGVN